MNKKIILSVLAGILFLAGIIAVAAAENNSCSRRQESAEISAETNEEIVTTEELKTTEEVRTTEEAVKSAEIPAASELKTTEEIIRTTAEEIVKEKENEQIAAEVITEEAVTDVLASNSGVSDAGLPYDVAALTAAAQTSQLVLAVGDGSLTGCMVYLFEKGEDSVWRMLLSTPGFWGRNGISYHTIEGDGTTPAGSYDFGLAFGNASNPGTALEWVDVNPYMYWIDDINSDYYNLLIDSRGVPDGWSSGEHLSQIVPEYNYAVNIEVNPDRRRDSTSAIFLHCGSKETAGCVGIPENCMVTILQRLRPGAKMIIAENASAVGLY